MGSDTGLILCTCVHESDVYLMFWSCFVYVRFQDVYRLFYLLLCGVGGWVWDGVGGGICFHSVLQCAVIPLT